MGGLGLESNRSQGQIDQHPPSGCRLNWQDICCSGKMTEKVYDTDRKQHRDTVISYIWALLQKQAQSWLKQALVATTILITLKFTSSLTSLFVLEAAILLFKKNL